MNFLFEERASASPLVETIWRTQSEQAGVFPSLAVSHCELVVTKYKGQTTLTMRGPETKATSAHCPEEAEFFGIVFKLGTFFPHLPVKTLVDRAVTLPEASSRSCWLHGSVWQFPDYDNAETFIDRLVRKDLLVHDPVVDAVLQDRRQELSLRSVQRRFLQATGLTQGTVCQIKRARQAMSLLEQGVSILDTVEQAGYADQPHLTRSLKRFIGQTPAQLIRASSFE